MPGTAGGGSASWPHMCRVPCPTRCIEGDLSSHVLWRWQTSELGAVRPSSSLELQLPRGRTRQGGLRISERRILLMVGDLAAVSVALLGALWLRLPWVPIMYMDWRALFLVELPWWLVLWAIWIPISITANCYSLPHAASAVQSAVRTGACALAVALIYLLVPRISAPLTASRTSWFVFAIMAVSGTALWRALYALLISQRSFARRVLVVGAGASGVALAETLRAARSTGIELVGYVDDDPSVSGREILGKQVLGGSGRLQELAEQYGVDEIAVALSDPGRLSPTLLEGLVRCWEQGVAVIRMTDYFEAATGLIPVEHLGSDLYALMGHQDSVAMRAWLVVRRLADVVVSLAGLAITAVLTPLVLLAMRLEGPGSLLYRQTRVGQGGRPFRIVKFRSMIPDAERDGAVWANPADPRVTRVGRVLRKTRIDELPQFWNVLIGDMTLIGPRPERPEFVVQLRDLLPYYAIRHSVKPGLSGWAQVSYHYGSSVQDALTKLQYDLYYVKHRGPVLDAVIALHTLRVLVTFQGR